MSLILEWEGKGRPGVKVISSSCGNGSGDTCCYNGYNGDQSEQSAPAEYEPWTHSDFSALRKIFGLR